MSYLAAVNLIKDISEAINPTGLFTHSDKWKAALNFNEVDRQICLYPITATVDQTHKFFESWTIGIGFYFQDSPSSSALEQQGLIATADDLVNEFMAVIAAVESVETRNFRKEPIYRELDGTYSGYVITFTLGTVVDLCGGSIIYPVLPNYPTFKNVYSFSVAGAGETVFVLSYLVGKELLEVSTDGVQRSSPIDFSFDSASGTITFTSEVDGLIQGLYK